MKSLFFSFFLLFCLGFSWLKPLNAQNCCPYIDAISLLPANPSDTDFVKLAVQVTTSSMGNFINSNVSFPTANNIEVNLCYFGGMLPALQTYNDTLSFGVLAAGTYNLQLIARQTPDQNDCNLGFVNDSSITFSVSTVTSLSPLPQPAAITHIACEDLNPLIQKQYGQNWVRLVNAAGQELFSGPLPLPGNIEPGLYLLEITSELQSTARIFWLKTGQ